MCLHICPQPIDLPTRNLESINAAPLKRSSFPALTNEALITLLLYFPSFSFLLTTSIFLGSSGKPGLGPFHTHKFVTYLLSFLFIKNGTSTMHWWHIWDSIGVLTIEEHHMRSIWPDCKTVWHLVAIFSFQNPVASIWSSPEFLNSSRALSIVMCSSSGWPIGHALLKTVLPPLP